MNIKSLLLGSAAALLAVSGARAADAVVVAEPEPMEYVRICDVYGAGFYYIPGTETCLKISGMVRYDIAFSSYSTDYDAAVGGTALNDGWAKQLTARVRFDARSETEFGTFRRFIELSSGNDGNEENSFNLRNAYIELGGLLVGHTDTLWDNDLPGEFDEEGGSRVNQIRYSFDAGNGIAVGVSLEEPTYNDDYVPNVVGHVGISQGWGAIDGYVAYDSGVEALNNDSWSAKVIGTFKATDAMTLGAAFTYNSEDNFYAPQGFWGGSEWTLAGGISYKVSDKLTVAGGAQWFGNQFLAGVHTNDNNWSVGANVDYTIVENLMARAAIKYEDGDSFTDGGATSGYLRLEAGF